MKCYRSKGEEVIHFSGDGGNERSSGKWGERDVG